jgi:FtsP/CotA-like multicopper oxidase with cupredoxin domain
MPARRITVLTALCAFALPFVASATVAGAQATGVTRTYYVAADEVDWDYMPDNADGMMGMKPEGYAKAYSDKNGHLIGKVYRKAIYREYTDATFTHLKPRPPSDAYLGIMGPILRAEVGDTIKIVFKNHGTHPYSMHPHGVFYKKSSEGSAYADGVPASAKGGDSVPPGGTFTYLWFAPERAGPGPKDPSSIVWLYHSHVEERRDVNSGLIGAIIITAKGKARPDGTPIDADREVVSTFVTFDENWSWFYKDNVKRNIKDLKKFNSVEAINKDPETGANDFLGTGFVPANFRWTINGYQFANGPMPRMKLGERVRWYVLTIGEGLNFHTPHWHGNTVLVAGQRTDVLSIAPAQMLTVDMIPDNPGIWLFHCHVSDHMDGGMVSRYEVAP